MSAPKQAKYTEEGLRAQFQSFKEAKSHFGMKARSWKLLASKLNEPSVKDLKKQVEELAIKMEFLKQENEKLKALAVKGKGFDEIGFWLLDRNFERSKFEDFGLDEEATDRKSVV